MGNNRPMPAGVEGGGKGREKTRREKRENGERENDL